MSSIEPDGSGGEVNGSEKISGGFVIAGGDCPELLDLAEEILDQMARFVEFSVKFARYDPVWPGRDDGGFASRRQWVKYSAIGIEGAVGDQQIGGHVRQQRIGAGQVVRVSRRQQQAHRIAERVDQGMDLCAQAAAAVA